MDLILGTAQLTRPYGVLNSVSGARSADKPKILLRTAEKKGYTGIDTAPVYGEAERVIGEAAIDLPIHTKLEPGVDVVKSIQQSLSRLRVSRIEILYQHEEFDGSSHQVQKLEEIQQLWHESVGQIGVSIYTRREFEFALDAEVVRVIQIPLNIADQTLSQEDLRSAALRGKKIYARSIFLQGVLLAPWETLPPAVSSLRGFVQQFQSLAKRWAMSPLQAAIAFVRSYEGLTGLVVGANSVANLQEIADGFNLSPREEFIEDCRNLPRLDKTLADPRTWL